MFNKDTYKQKKQEFRGTEVKDKKIMKTVFYEKIWQLFMGHTTLAHL